jgi:imidazoleglycerol-phosphate dehydratase
MARRAEVERRTGETSVRVELDLDGRGNAVVATGIGFFDHMLHALARHGSFDLTVRAEGDLHVDDHHTAEDIGIVLGRAFREALGDRKGIRRMAHAIVPLDEALALVAVDIGGRGYAVVDATFATPRIGQMDADLVRHFIETMAHEAHMNIHVRLLAGENDHHKAEAIFKALARALDAATQHDERLGEDVPSTKGMLD